MDDLTISRRRLLAGSAAAAAGAVLLGDVRPAAATVLPRDPFALGVASGDPLPSAVVLWTRLVHHLHDAGSMPPHPVPVRWQVATDASFRRVVRRGTALARPDLAHSVHVDVGGLEPGRDYFYRFRAHQHVSPTGRTRTAPAAGSSPDRLRLGVVNCQDWQNGYWPAYLGLAEEDLDVVLHLGDYIYEYDPRSAFPDRLHTTPARSGLDQLRTLADYRARHAQYKSDPALQGAHARFPWIVTWDDHETENNYANLVDETDDRGERLQRRAEFARQRAAAYQAYWEHLPLRPVPVPGSPWFRIYRSFDFGDLARVAVLDTRQYRTDQPGDLPFDFGPEALGRTNERGTLTGGHQQRWLRGRLASSRATWNVLAQQVLMSRIRFPNFLDPGGPLPFIANLDQWDGYAPARARLVDWLIRREIANPVVLAGDIHSTWFSELNVDVDDPTSRTVGVEFTATSVSSDFPIAFDAPLKAANPLLNPHVKYFDGSLRGYLRMDVDRERWLTEARTVASIAVRESPVTTTAAFACPVGAPGLVPA